MGTKELTYDLMRQIEQMPVEIFEEEEETEQQKVEFKWDDYHEQQVKDAADDDDDDWDDWNEDDYDVEIIYKP